MNAIGTALYFVTAILICAVWLVHRNDRWKMIRWGMAVSSLPIAGGLLQAFNGRAPFTMALFAAALVFLYNMFERDQISTDALTGLNNRDRLNRYLAVRLVKADSEPFYIFMIDLDDFKNINDTYGHVAGDDALMAVAQGIRNAASLYDSLFALWGR